MKRMTFKGIGLAALSAGMTAAFAMTSVPAKAENYKIAFLAASSENGFNQAIWEGVKKRAAKLAMSKSKSSTASSTPRSNTTRSKTWWLEEIPRHHPRAQ